MSTRLIIGDCRDVLPTLAAGSVQCVVTSPPYFGLRDYDVEGQIGLEATPAEYVAEIVAVFREVWRVLRDDGPCWLNLGDSYSNDTKWGGSTSGKHVTAMHGDTGIGRTKKTTGMKPKDLMGMPWRVALALQDDGWYLRRDIIWAKPNPMPESVTDRPTTAHEYVFLLTKRAKYFYDAEAVREPQTEGTHERFGKNPAPASKAKIAEPGSGIKNNSSFNASMVSMILPNGRNLRSVWTIATAPFAQAHFATFPPKLAETCILAGTSERGACPQCGAPWARMTQAVDTGKKQKMTDSWEIGPGTHGTIHPRGRSKGEAGVAVTANVTIGWRQTCHCPAAEPRPCVVLDPFSGAGTVGLVADRLQRNAIQIELNADYAAMTEQRIVRDAGLFAEVAS